MLYSLLTDEEIKMAEQPPPYTAPYPAQPQAYPGYPPQQQSYPAQQQGYPPQQPGYPPQQPGYPPQQKGYPPPQPYTPQPVAQPPPQIQQTSSTTVVMQQQPTVVVTNTSFGNGSTAMQCPFCSATITTSVNYIEGTMVWLLAGVLCIVGCWPCCLIPFCVDDCKDVQHSCPNCRRVVGTFRRM